MPKYDLNGRRFTALFNAAHGQVDHETIFNYYQKEDHIWAIYQGGQIRIGTLSGHFIEEDVIFLHYGHWDSTGAFRSGTSRSVISAQSDGRIRLHETWKWDDDDIDGESIMVEVV